VKLKLQIYGHRSHGRNTLMAQALGDLIQSAVRREGLHQFFEPATSGLWAPRHTSQAAHPLSPTAPRPKPTDPCAPPHLCHLEPSRLHIWLHPRGPPARPQSPVERLGHTSPC